MARFQPNNPPPCASSARSAPVSPSSSFLTTGLISLHLLSRIKTTPPTHRRVPLTHAPNHTYRRQGTSHHMRRRGQEGQIGKENRRRVIVLSTAKAAEGLQETTKSKARRGRGLGVCVCGKATLFVSCRAGARPCPSKIEPSHQAVHQSIFRRGRSIGKQQRHQIFPSSHTSSSQHAKMHHTSRSGSLAMLSARLPPPAFYI